MNAAAVPLAPRPPRPWKDEAADFAALLLPVLALAWAANRWSPDPPAEAEPPKLGSPQTIAADPQPKDTNP